MQPHSPPPLVELRPEEPMHTAGAAAAPLLPPAPMICYWPVRRPSLTLRSAAPAVAPRGPQRA